MLATLKSLRGLTLFFCVLGSGGGSFLWSDVESQLPDFGGASLPDIACLWSFHLDLYRIGYSECGESFWSSDSLVVCSSGRAVLLPPPPSGRRRRTDSVPDSQSLQPHPSTEHAPPADGARSSPRWSTLRRTSYSAETARWAFLRCHCRNFCHLPWRSGVPVITRKEGAP